MPDLPIWDSWVRVDGPTADLGDVLSDNVISPELSTAALTAMAAAGHEA
ncbi:hypothetical protein [Cryobacterium sp. Y29]|nr:hypothetical protein [Cryobacterium sp. Y29]